MYESICWHQTSFEDVRYLKRGYSAGENTPSQIHLWRHKPLANTTIMPHRDYILQTLLDFRIWKVQPISGAVRCELGPKVILLTNINPARLGCFVFIFIDFLSDTLLWRQMPPLSILLPILITPSNKGCTVTMTLTESLYFIYPLYSYQYRPSCMLTSRITSVHSTIQRYHILKKKWTWNISGEIKHERFQKFG